jgi:prophage endopeptidase
VSLWRWIGLAVLVGCSVFATWKVDTWRYGKQLARMNASHQAALTAISNAAAAQARQALERQQATQKALAELDAKASTEKAHALAENEKLRADVAAGDRRLRIAGRCSASSSNLLDTFSTARLDDGSTVELAGAAGRTVFDIRAGIIKDQVALKGLQAYVREVCQQ